jgi:Protein of unknown function (DUF1348)
MQMRHFARSRGATVGAAHREAPGARTRGARAHGGGAHERGNRRAARYLRAHRREARRQRDGEAADPGGRGRPPPGAGGRDVPRLGVDRGGWRQEATSAAVQRGDRAPERADRRGRVNNRNPERVAAAHTQDSQWRNRDESSRACVAIVDLLRKWSRSPRRGAQRRVRAAETPKTPPAPTGSRGPRALRRGRRGARRSAANPCCRRREQAGRELPPPCDIASDDQQVVTDCPHRPGDSVEPTVDVDQVGDPHRAAHGPY